VRNYFHISAINKIYAIFQGITHEWFLPILLKHLPFIGGTNFFVDKQLLYKLKGFNLKSLTEDLDFGIRAYMQEKQWPEFLPYVTTEQTPPNYKAYFFQRARWAAGFFQITENLMFEKVSKAALYILSGLTFYGIIPLILIQIISFISIILLLPSLTGIIDTSGFLTFKLKAFFIGMNILYLGFILSYYERSKRRGYIQMPEVKPRFGFVGEYLTFAGLLIAPFFGCLPFTYGFFNVLFNKSSLKWVKTPRTTETVIT
jgi:cellulose synthase/poly-beta-1,6-N-acetylglucosamine synthase-like glycosyltransferase